MKKYINSTDTYEDFQELNKLVTKYTDKIKYLKKLLKDFNDEPKFVKQIKNLLFKCDKIIDIPDDFDKLEELIFE